MFAGRAAVIGLCAAVVWTSGAGADDPFYTGKRLTLLINYWDRRPLPPVCRDYDGTVYKALQEED